MLSYNLTSEGEHHDTPALGGPWCPSAAAWRLSPAPETLTQTQQSYHHLEHCSDTGAETASVSVSGRHPAGPCCPRHPLLLQVKVSSYCLKITILNI
ncbi:hypothetical protein E2C01_031618 [Portunus trituberculatus]|uniref:Uncharacterized protein n=1 Tax=Portunus trituberculatus TaxID=210409 RepID=A0A5B7EY26_PORTR|nr:hypothetical protein [Portunus trituberculatus]